MRNLLPMDTAPRDGTRILVVFDGLYLVAWWLDDLLAWESDGLVSLAKDASLDGWWPTPDCNPLPMSTAPKDGRRIQVKVFRGEDATATWEYVEWKEFGSGDYRKLDWYGEWMTFADASERDESNWLGWFPTPGED